MSIENPNSGLSESLDNYLTQTYYAVRGYDGTNENTKLLSNPDFIPTRSFFYPNKDGASSSIIIPNRVLLEDWSFWKKEGSKVILKPNTFRRIFGLTADRIAMIAGILNQVGIGFSTEPVSKIVKSRTERTLYRAGLYEENVYIGKPSLEQVGYLTGQNKSTLLSLNVNPNAGSGDLSFMLAGSSDGILCDSVFFAQMQGRCLNTSVFGPNREDFAANPMAYIDHGLAQILPTYPSQGGPPRLFHNV